MSNKIARFANESSTTYTSDTGLRYSDDYWFSDSGSTKTKGFLPNTPMSSLVFNTVLNQTSFVAYIVGNILSGGIIKDKSNKPLMVDSAGKAIDISVDTAPSDIITPFNSYLNRINDISGNGSTGSESVWRARQLGSGDSTGLNYWLVDGLGNLKPNTNSNYITDSTGSCTVKFNSDSLSINKPFYITGLLDVTSTIAAGSDITSGGSIKASGNIESSGTLKVSNTSTFLGDITLGATSNNKDINMQMRYNNSGTTLSNTYRTLGVEDALYSIGTRLDNLGFKSGSVTPASTATTTVNWLRKQGEYVLGHFTASRTGTNLTGWMIGSTLFTIPLGFRPYENYTICVGGSYATSSGTGTGAKAELEIRTTGAAVWKSFNGSTTGTASLTNIDIQFGHSISAYKS